MKRLLALFLLLALLLTACMDGPATTIPGPDLGRPTVATDPTGSVTPTDPTQLPDAPTEPTPGPTEPSATPTQPSTSPTEPSTAPTQPTTAPTEPSTAPTQPQLPEVCLVHQTDPYVGVDKEKFYDAYSPACCYNDAMYRTQHFLLSGSMEVPGQYAQEADYRPMDGDRYIRNTTCYYLDGGNTYVVVGADGVEVMRIYKGAAYITLEEVAAYMYAFGGKGCVLPANYTSAKKTSPANNPWGVYLRVNHSYFSGDTSRYPYEPELPDTNGCGGQLQYFELDIGTTGTTTPGYQPYPYNNGHSITRGAARLVYARQDKNGNGIYEIDEVYVFYTHNHYNDFREYLNYYGGWGEMFGNMTGGGEYSSKYNCNPTPYPVTAYEAFSVSVPRWDI